MQYLAKGLLEVLQEDELVENTNRMMQQQQQMQNQQLMLLAAAGMSHAPMLPGPPVGPPMPMAPLQPMMLGPMPLAAGPMPMAPCPRRPCTVTPIVEEPEDFTVPTPKSMGPPVRSRPPPEPSRSPIRPGKARAPTDWVKGTTGKSSAPALLPSAPRSAAKTGASMPARSDASVSFTFKSCLFPKQCGHTEGFLR